MSILTIFVQNLPMRIAIYLPQDFYSGVASALFEMIQVINQLSRQSLISVDFISAQKQARSRSGVFFSAQTAFNKKIDVLILMAGAGAELEPNTAILDEEASKAHPIIRKAIQDHAIIGATCGASYFLAYDGLLNGRRATISWWLKKVAMQKFPEVKWEPSRMVIRSKNIYTSGGGFSGFELLSAILIDSGFSEEEKLVRKLMVLPPARTSQVPYEIVQPLPTTGSNFIERAENVARKYLPQLNVRLLADELHMSPRTLARKFLDELSISPGKWIQEKKLLMAKLLLENGRRTVEEICFETGYEDLSSFSRLFKKTTGMSPTEYKKHFATVANHM